MQKENNDGIDEVYVENHVLMKCCNMKEGKNQIPTL